MINLNIEPRIEKSWKRFIRENPPYSIALDGYVRDKPRFTPKGPYANFDHHYGVNRLSTRSTTGQTYNAIKLGLLTRFRDEKGVKINLNVNDCDQDVCPAVWLFYNHDRIELNKSEPLITRLVGVVDLLDSSGGVYPISPSTKIMKEIGWIFEPYTDARFKGRVKNMNANEMKIIIDSVCDRISRYTIGKGEQIELDTRYEKIFSENNWAVIREIGQHARSRLLMDGIEAFASVLEVDGKFFYSIGRLSQLIDFPIEILYKKLNMIERCDESSSNRWGGSDLIGGSPRLTGSKIPPKDLVDLIKKTLSEQNKLYK
ncbi:MAG: hypothetical protein AABX61_02490 [Nanoarchaeota archaeon]